MDDVLHFEYDCELSDALGYLMVNFDFSTENDSLLFVCITIIKLLSKLENVSEGCVSNIGSFFDANIEMLIPNDDAFIIFTTFLFTRRYISAYNLPIAEYMMHILEDTEKNELIRINFLHILSLQYSIADNIEDFLIITQSIMHTLQIIYMSTARTASFEVLLSIASKNNPSLNNIIREFLKNEKMDEYSNDELIMLARLLTELTLSFQDSILQNDNSILVEMTLELIQNMSIDIACTIFPIIKVLIEKGSEEIIEKLELEDMLNYLKTNTGDVNVKISERYGIIVEYLESYLNLKDED